LKAKKSFGQHFLKDETIATKIVEALVCEKAFHSIIEVGPGQGVLTKYLLEKSDYNFTAIEADIDMVTILHQNYPALEGKIIHQDFLKVSLSDVTNNQETALIGNFPYNISTQIVFKVLQFKYMIPVMVGMFQKEVAERICAKPGSKTYGILSVLCQAFFHTQYLFTVKAGSFNPPPKVLSAVIRLAKKEDTEMENFDEDLFFHLVKISFGQRRKMLRNTLKNIFPEYVLEEEFFKQRPEQLGFSDFIHLCHRKEKIKNEKGTDH
jgi:16S rRNA (adenine1518-N6/adenine1519-N6)-dimethyltransferase